MDKPKAKINLRVKDVGDFVQVELRIMERGSVQGSAQYF